MVLTTLPNMPTADEVEIAAKFIHLTVYVKLLLSKSFSGQKSSILKPWVASIAAQSWLNYLGPVYVYLYMLHVGFICEAEF